MKNLNYKIILITFILSFLTEMVCASVTLEKYLRVPVGRTLPVKAGVSIRKEVFVLSKITGHSYALLETIELRLSDSAVWGTLQKWEWVHKNPKNEEEIVSLKLWVLKVNHKAIRLTVAVDEDISGKIFNDRITGMVTADFNPDTVIVGRPSIQEILPSRKSLVSVEDAVYASGNENIAWDAGKIVWKTGKLIHNRKEKIPGTSYPCICIERDGKVKFHILEFQEQGEEPFWGAFRKENGQLTPYPELEIAFTINPLIENGDKLPLENALPYFVDLRHVFQLPYLNQRVLSELAIQTEGLMSGALFFGLDQLTQDQSLSRQALKGPVTISREIKYYEKNEQGDLVEKRKQIPLSLLRHVLWNEGYKEIMYGEVISQKTYKFGQDSIEIFFAQAPYPHHVFGICDDGDWVEIFLPGRSGFQGMTLEELTGFMLNLDYKILTAGSVDQGGGVNLWLKEGDTMNPIIPSSYDTSVSMIIWIRRESLSSL